jgi:hypothetical protein
VELREGLVRKLVPRDGARITLAGIRIFNGSLGLLAPRLLAGRMGAQAEAGAAVYAFRMFGIRTILIGADLLARDPDVRRHAVRLALVVHVSDTLSAVSAGVRHEVPRRAAVTATAISSLNVVLSLVASRGASSS